MTTVRLVIRSMLLLLTLPIAAHGGDGVVEINQARALAGGLSPFDTPGFPVTISTPGSYRLTSNLDVNFDAQPSAAADRTAIYIIASDVTLDLSGFLISGGTLCSGLPVTNCSDTGSGSGVEIHFGVRNIEVRNGSIYGMGKSGILVNSGPISIEGIRARGNGADGIASFSGIAVSVRNTTAYANGGVGILVTGNDGLVQNCVSSYNHGGGIQASMVTGSSTFLNVGVGIQCAGLAIGNSIQTDGAIGLGGSSLAINNSIANYGAAITALEAAAHAGNRVYGGTISASSKALGPNLCPTGVCP